MCLIFVMPGGGRLDRPLGEREGRPFVRVLRDLRAEERNGDQGHQGRDRQCDREAVAGLHEALYERGCGVVPTRRRCSGLCLPDNGCESRHRDDVPGFSDRAVAFYAELAANNTRDFWAAHKAV